MQVFEADIGARAQFHRRKFPAPARSDTIFVCPLSHVARMVASTGARHLVTLANSSVVVETPRQVIAGRHLRLVMNDICEPQLGLTSPQLRHIEDFVDFVVGWDQKAPLLIHCLAGISRSTAGCLIALCALNPHVAEADIARRLRAASATAMPNRLLVSLADEHLSRGGRLLAALDVMGPGQLQSEGIPFAMPAQIGL
jgi:predicted protein tyrosine phosphatase